MTQRKWWVFMIAILGACDNSSPIPSEPLSVTPAQSPLELPNWAEEDDGVYYYISALSQEDIQAGRAAGSVLGFRYLGKNADNEHILASIADNGQIIEKSYCSDYCTIVRYEGGRRIAYSRDSVIGTAFEDAFRGLLSSDIANDAAQSAPRALPAPRLTALDDSDWGRVGIGCACTFADAASRSSILIAGGNDNLIIRPEGRLETCTLREERLQQMFDGEVIFNCANSRISVQENGPREPGVDGHSSPARLTISAGQDEHSYDGNWQCEC